MSSSVTEVASEILVNVQRAIHRIPRKQINRVIATLLGVQQRKKKLMVIGIGRSGLVGKAFAMRLMHLGFNVHVVGETITPALHKDDILIAISGSGETSFVVSAASIAKKVKAKVIALTSHPRSALGKLSDLIVKIPGRVKIAGGRDYFSRQILGEHEPLVPLGTLFEVSTMVFLDSLVVELMRRLKTTEEEMRARHATIE